MRTKSCSIITPLVLLLASMHASAQQATSQPTLPAEQKSAPAESKPITAPKGKLLFDQRFRKVGDPDTPGAGESIGTGFFARTPSGEVVAITSIHFLELEGQPYDSITWTDAAGKEVARSTTSFGIPGNQPDFDADFVDLSRDYLVLKLEAEPQGVEILELDERSKPEARSKENNEQGEKVWFPYPAKNAAGFRMIQGDVSVTRSKKIIVMFKNAKGIELQGCSGTPVLSQKTGKVLGLLASGGDVLGNYVINLAPVAGIKKAIAKGEKDKHFPRLREIDWSKHGPVIEEPKPAEKPAEKKGP